MINKIETIKWCDTDYVIEYTYCHKDKVAIVESINGKAAKHFPAFLLTDASEYLEELEAKQFETEKESIAQYAIDERGRYD